MCNPRVKYALNFQKNTLRMQVFDEKNSLELVETSFLLDVQERVEAFPPGGCDLFLFSFLFPSLSLVPRWSLFCCRVTQPCYLKPSGISVVTSLLFSLSGLMSMLSQCCFMVRSDSSDEVLKSGLSSSSHCPRPGLDLNAKNGSEANLWLWWQ